MEVFKLLGVLAIENADANKAIDETTDKAEKSQSKLSKIFAGIGKGLLGAGKVIATGIGVGVGALSALTGKAVAAAGELEQNMGGSEAVFGKYASKMQENAKKAFNSMGLSASDYLATANKMGSLFKGAGFETEQAMDMTSKAMQRAADVASIMGLDTSAAMEAIAGAAKGNFTMMDNLGVAINDTTLQAYAQEKGLGKLETTQQKVNAAIELFMEKTEGYAGNYTKENETIAGSMGTLKAAFDNFLSGVGSVDDVIASASGAAQSMVKQITDLFPKLVSGITKMAKELVPMIPPLIEQALPALISGTTDLINGLVAAFPSIMKALLKAAPALIDGILQVFLILIDNLPLFVEMIVEALPTLIPMIVDGAVALIVAICENMPLIIKPIIDNLPMILGSILSAVFDNLPLLMGGLVSVVGELVGGFQAVAEWGREHEEVVTLIGIAIGTVTAALIAYNSAAIIKKAIDIAETIALVAMTAATTAHSIATTVATAATTAFGAAVAFLTSPITLVIFAIGALIAIVVLCVKHWDEIKEAGAKAWEWIKNAWAGAKEWFAGVWDGIKNVFANVGSWFSEKFEAAKQGVKNAWSTVKDFFSNIWSGIKNVFSTIGNWFSEKFNAAKQGVQNAFSGIKNFFSNIKNGIVNAFSNIKEKLSAPFTKARDTIKGIADKIKGFFKGEIKMPKIKMPHFKLSPSGWKVGDLLKGSIPKISIDWYKKAMDSGMILNDATIFGMNSSGQLLGGGEAGSETVVGTGSLLGMINGAVQQETAALAVKMDRLLDMLATYFPQMLEAASRDLSWDDETVARRIAPAMNAELYSIGVRNGRGG